MSIIATGFSRFSRFFGQFRAGTIITLMALVGVGTYAVSETNAYKTGINGQTQKSGNSGCSCHCTSSNSATSVSLTTGSTTFVTGQTYSFTVTVANSSESGAGCDVSTFYAGTTGGSSLAAPTGSGLQVIGGEITHTTPKSGTSCSWTFNYTAPTSPCDDTIYATGNAVNLDNTNGAGNCADKWNFASKYVVHVVGQPRGLTSSSSAFALGSVRVGSRKAAITTLQATGTSQITINGTSMKTGSQFFTNSTNGTGSRSMNPILTETDTVIFVPSARGSFVDSLIITTNSDTVAKQRIAIPATGQGIQAVFSNSLGTLAYGNTKLSATAPKMSFIYSNSGDDTLFLSQPNLTGTGFTITKQPNSLALPPNGVDTVVVQFTPLARQAYNGSLAFTASNGVTAPTITLTGTGVAPLLQANASSAIGNARVGAPLQGLYTIKNTGNDTMHITNVALNPATGSKFTLGTYDATILPNGTGTFRLSYTPTVEKTDSVQLKFSTDDAAASNFTALIMASGVLPHMFVDTTTVNIGEAKVNFAISHDFQVTNNGGADLSLNVILEGDPVFSLLTAPQTVQAGANGFISVKFSPTSAGTYNGRLIISGDDASHPRDTVRFTASGTNSALTITPSVANFNYVPVGVTMFDTLALANTGNAPVKILSYTLTGSSTFKVVDTSAHQIAANGTGRIILSFNPTDIGGFNGSLVLKTDENVPTHTISVSGVGIQGAITPSIIALDFGTVDTGSTKTLTASLKNTGSAAIKVTSLAIVPASNDYTFVATPAAPTTVQPNDSIDVSITFAPHAAGKADAALKLTTEDGTTGNILTFVGVGHVTQQNNGVADHAIAGLRMSLVPNPAHAATAVMLTLDEPQSLRMVAIDALGREVIAQNLGMVGAGQHSVELPIANLAAGSYFVRIIGTNGAMETKLVIER